MRIIKHFKEKDRQGLYKHFIFLIFLILTSCLLLWKCKYGFGNVDESFYITVPYRLFKGDALFVHEWHLSQMSGVLMLPVVAAYVIFKGSTVGIVLFLRYVCTVAQIITAVFIYVRLNRINWLGALISSVSYLLYIPFGIMALSYNSIAIMSLIICTVIIFTAKNKKAIQYIIAGIFYAAAVLCCPYLALVFLMYVFTVCIVRLIYRLKGLEKKTEFYFFTLKGALFLSVGAALAAISFAAFVFSRASLSEIVQAFPIIMDDPEHPPISLMKSIKSFIVFIIEYNSVSRYVYPVLIVLAGICLADKKRTEHKLSYISVALCCVLLLMLGYFNINQYINNMMWSVNILAFFVTAVTSREDIKNIFYTVWITGILYAFCLNTTSNQGFLAISSASAVALVGSIMIVCIFLCELSKENIISSLKNTVMILICVVMVLQIYMQGLLRYKSVFWETDMASQKVRIDDGFNAGLYVTEKKYKQYYTALDNLSVLEEYDAENVLYLSKVTWYYLVGDYNMSAYSAWLSGVNGHSVKRLKAYYELNPEKLPDVVYADKKYEDIAKLFCEEFGYKIDKADNAFIILKKDKR